MNLLDIDLSQPVDAMFKTGTMLLVATGLEFASGFPPLLMDCAKFLAYLGASIAFWKFMGMLLFPSKFKKKESE
jgi:hypothetical protein